MRLKQRTASLALALTLVGSLALPVDALAAERFDEATIYYQTTKAAFDEEGFLQGMQWEDATVVFSSAYTVWAEVPYWAERYSIGYDYEKHQPMEGTGAYTQESWVLVLGPNCQITVNDPLWGTDGILADDGEEGLASYTYTPEGFVLDEEPAYDGSTGQEWLDLLTAKESQGKLFTMSLYDGIANCRYYIYAAGDGEIPAFLEREAPSPWAAADVEAAIDTKIVPMTLRDDYTQPITRAEFCALGTALYETCMGREIDTVEEFDDTVDLNVGKMAGLGVVQGVGEGLFDPDGLLNREQAAAILARLAEKLGHPLEKREATFGDAGQVSPWAAEAVGQMQASGIMGGVGDNTFSPTLSYTREQSILTALRLLRLAQEK